MPFDSKTTSMVGFEGFLSFYSHLSAKIGSIFVPINDVVT